MPVCPDPHDISFVRELLRADGADTELVRRAASVKNWSELFKWALGHGLAPLLYHRVKLCSPQLPEDHIPQWREAYYQNATQSLQLAAELLQLAEAFLHEDIPALPFKGVALAAMVYGDPAIRPAGDLDWLIAHHDLGRCQALLEGMGYRLHTPVDDTGVPVHPGTYEYHFERHSDGMVVELRWRLTPAHMRSEFGLADMWQSRRTASLAGHTIPTAAPEQLLLMLAVHGYKHRWSRLIWICDIAELLRSNPALDWALIEREASRLGMSSVVRLALLLAERVCRAAMPEFQFKRSEADPATRRWAKQIEHDLFCAKQEPHPQGLPYEVDLLDRADRARWYLQPLRHAVALRPTSRDRALVSLPQYLHFLYYLVRPVRLVREYLLRKSP